MPSLKFAEEITLLQPQKKLKYTIPQYHFCPISFPYLSKISFIHMNVASITYTTTHPPSRDLVDDTSSLDFISTCPAHPICLHETILIVRRQDL